ncbi:MAG: hypothetical protein JWN73_2659 [Betaproteobacteria bacterium]|nr:hypothetical protein [Betaproteobacteria bacterium]
MADPINVLIVQDVEEDAALWIAALKESGLDCAGYRVHLQEDFSLALAEFKPRVILSDMNLAEFGGMDALSIARDKSPGIPFIFISSASGEAQAVKGLRSGATDYFLKGSLTRLGPIVERALRDADARSARDVADSKVHDNQRLFAATFDQAVVGIAHLDASGRFIQVNRRLAEMLGYKPAEMIGLIAKELAHAEDFEATGEFRQQLLTGQIDSFTKERRFLHKDGQTVWMRLTVTLMHWPDDQSVNDVTVFEDITERKRGDQILRLEHVVAHCLAGADDAPTAQKAIIRAICETEGWDCGRYFALDEAAGVLRFDEFWAKDEPALDQFIASSRGMTFRPGEGLVGAVWLSGEPVWLADASADSRVKRGADISAADLHAAFIFPIFAGGKTIGVLAFLNGEIQTPDARLMKAVGVIAGQIGQFMLRQAQQNHIARLNRIHRVLSGINSLIVRVDNRDELFQEACRIAVEDGHFALAWIGIVDRRAMALKIVALRDTTQGYTDLIPLSVVDSAPGGLGMAGRAVFERKPVIVNNIEASSQLLLLKKDALARGFRSVAVLPLTDSIGVTGVLSLYADTINFFDEGEVKLLLELAGDISFAIDHLEKSERLTYLARYDVLTGLANRTLFQERVNLYIDGAAGQGHRLAVLVIDIERFKLINDSLGRVVGDMLLKLIVERFVRRPGNHSLFAHLGADQFAMVLPAVQSDEGLARRIERGLTEYFGERFQIAERELKIAARVGVAIYPDHGGDANTLVTNAESALKRAKESSEKFVFYAKHMSNSDGGQLTLENQLRRALERDEFELYYQPKLNLATQRIEAIEGLIRWKSPELGLVPPLKFIPLMEQTGLILEVGAWVLRRAVLDYRIMQVLGVPPLRIAVNVSPIQLRRANFVDVVKDAIRDTGSAPGIDLEITESLMMEDIEGNIEKLKAIRALGVNIAIDDFGTGYSSLGYLARLPADYLKIDRSFIISMLKEQNSMTLVSTIISLAHSLKLKVIAEGVDAQEQEDALTLLHCDEIQGYLISPALPLQDMLAFTRKWSESKGKSS